MGPIVGVSSGKTVLGARPAHVWRGWFWVVIWSAMSSLWAPVHADGNFHQRIDGIDVYLAVVPAELVGGHPREHDESRMHGERALQQSHLIVGLVAADSGRRIVDAAVEAEVHGETATVRRSLEPMLVGGARDYGNYFTLPGPAPYRIVLSIRLPGRVDALRVEFEWGRT